MPIARADANPTKSFFVRMLTRDISLDDCVLDLVDNSIDGAWALSGDRPRLEKSTRLQKYWVNISISPDHFRIQDNCGGITLENAQRYAFTFGRRDLDGDGDGGEPRDAGESGYDHDARYSVGVYGIGMKRAIFKIGRSIRIRSTYATNGSVDSFKIPIEVGEWLADDAPSWDFPIESADDLDEAGVLIAIKDLAEETRNRFRDPTYLTSLRRVLARDYLLPLMHGLTITVNDAAITYRPFELRQGADFAPMRDTYLDGQVTVEILAGMVAPPPDDASPDESAKVDATSGWYLLCNGRVILAADTSTLTGWGVELPRWHNQYSGFLGMALFTSEHPELLPMTTTKRGVDVSSAVYLRAREKMSRPAREWIDYTNARKQDLDSAKHREGDSEGLEVTEVPPSPKVRLPSLNRRSAERPANINYARPVTRVRQLAAALDDINLTYRDVGLQSFEYAYKMLVDEDD